MIPHAFLCLTSGIFSEKEGDNSREKKSCKGSKEMEERNHG